MPPPPELPELPVPELPRPPDALLRERLELLRFVAPLDFDEPLADRDEPDFADPADLDALDDDFLAVLREAELLPPDLAPERVEPELDFAADDRLDPEPDLARVEPDFLALPLERDELPELFDPLDRAELPPELAEALPPASALHLPLITRCAASATASAMIEPSLVALDTTLLAARSAVSAASSPASRIFLRAAGLALIAAAAAASPAASISLLIAALASLSTVVSLLDEPEPDRDEVDREELLRADLAIAQTPSVAGKTL